jgi:hypothetical protein
MQSWTLAPSVPRLQGSSKAHLGRQVGGEGGGWEEGESHTVIDAPTTSNTSCEIAKIRITAASLNLIYLFI